MAIMRAAGNMAWVRVLLRIVAAVWQDAADITRRGGAAELRRGLPAGSRRYSRLETCATLCIRGVVALRVYALLAGLLLLSGCGRGDGQRAVVVYTSHDQIYSEPLFRRFEENTGVRVKAVYDTEATKTVGLANRLEAEARNPQCDVFWNNEVIRTVILKRKGALERYVSESARDIPPGMKDAEGYWAGFAARARVLIWNTNTALTPALSHPMGEGE